MGKIEDLFTYDKDSGIVCHNINRPKDTFPSERKYNLWRKRWAGKEAGRKNKLGYVYCYATYCGKSEHYLAHRVALILSGYTISDGYEVDHINLVRWDNRLINLRVVTLQENRIKKGVYKKNTSGYSGVRASGRGWSVTIGVKGKPLYLGTFLNKEDAIAVRLKAEDKYGY